VEAYRVSHHGVVVARRKERTMIRNVLHKFVAYRKRIERYTIKVEFLSGRWWVWVTGPAVSTNKEPDLLMGHEMFTYNSINKPTNFDEARKVGLEFVRNHCSR
jgi:hypothetical protein